MSSMRLLHPERTLVDWVRINPGCTYRGGMWMVRRVDGSVEKAYGDQIFVHHGHLFLDSNAGAPAPDVSTEEEERPAGLLVWIVLVLFCATFGSIVYFAAGGR